MANYEEFKKTMEERILSFLPEKYQSGEILISPVNRENYQTDMLSVITSSNTYSPSLDLRKLFRLYENSGNMNLVLQEAASDFKITDSKITDSEFPRSPRLLLKDAKSRIVFQLVNTEKNEEFLKTVPHRNFLDLSVIYKCLVAENGHEICSFIVTKSMTELFDSEEVLFTLAMENTKKLLPFRYGLLTDEPLEHMPELTREIPESTLKDNMLLVTSSLHFNGATVMLYPDVLDKIAEKTGSDLYILPSSVHEILCRATYAEVTVAGLKEMVMLVNADSSAISPEEFLSDNIYRYSRAKKQITIAAEDGLMTNADRLQKQILGKSAEMEVME